jgi:hypothetical protein
MLRSVKLRAIVLGFLVEPVQNSRSLVKQFPGLGQRSGNRVAVLI